MRWLILAIMLSAGPPAVHASGLEEARAGLAAAQRGDDDEALRRYSAAIAAGDLSPFNVMLAYHNRGNTYQDKGDYRQAIPEYRTAIKLQPVYAEAWFARGRAWFSLGEYANAMVDFAQSLKLDPADAYAALWLHLARRKSAPSDAGELSRNAVKFDRTMWPGPLLGLYLGEATPQQVRAASQRGDAATRKDQACEAAFYIAEYELLRNNMAAAGSLFREAAMICPYTSDERDGAAVELNRNQFPQVK
ncbi:MAG TPA: tetratricopeptide repeat protein [Micropepsaceae bacterium]|nr:tetratricopeptide repeat protein [Micropepsaceae bacterium]